MRNEGNEEMGMTPYDRVSGRVFGVDRGRERRIRLSGIVGMSVEDGEISTFARRTHVCTSVAAHRSIQGVWHLAPRSAISFSSF